MISVGDKVLVVDNKFHNGRVGQVINIPNPNTLALMDTQNETKFFCVKAKQVEPYAEQ